MAVSNVAFILPLNAQKGARILFIEIGQGNYAKFRAEIASLGNTLNLPIEDVAKYSVDYLKSNFDVFATTDYPSSDHGTWLGFTGLMGSILSLVENGKNLIVEVGFGGVYPGESFTQTKYNIPTPKDVVEYDIVNNTLTAGVRSIKGTNIDTFLSGGYPLVSSPRKVGYPDPPMSPIVYGTYGSGRYIITTGWVPGDFSGLTGDVGVLFSNVLHWISNREVSPPLSIAAISESLIALNDTIRSLGLKALELQGTLKNLNIENVSSDLSNLKSDLSNLKSDFTSLKNQVNWMYYMSIFSVMMSLVAIIIVIIRKK